MSNEIANDTLFIPEWKSAAFLHLLCAHEVFSDVIYITNDKVIVKGAGNGHFWKMVPLN